MKLAAPLLIILPLSICLYVYLVLSDLPALLVFFLLIIISLIIYACFVNIPIFLNIRYTTLLILLILLISFMFLFIFICFVYFYMPGMFCIKAIIHSTVLSQKLTAVVYYFILPSILCYLIARLLI